MSFDQYQTKDANRKAVIAKAGITDYQRIQTFNGIVDKYNKSPLVAASDRTNILNSTIENIKKDPTNGGNQLSLIYGYIQALDNYQSAVREGEIALSQQIQSKVGAMQNYFQQITNGQILNKKAALDMANAASSLVQTIQSSAKQKAASFQAQADVAGVGSEFSQYVGKFQPSYEKEVKDEKQKKETVDSYLDKSLGGLIDNYIKGLPK